MTWEGGNHVHELEEDSEPFDLGFLALHWLGLLWLELDTDDSPDVRDPDEEGSECDHSVHSFSEFGQKQEDLKGICCLR